MTPSFANCLSLRLHSYGITRLFIPGVLLLLCICACTGQKKQTVYTIGFSQCVESDAWRKTMLEGMKRELAFHANINFIYRQADGNSQQQVNQVKELLQKKIDLLIISPNEADPLTPVVEEAFSKGIPVIVVDRKISSPLYTAYVGGDNYEIGKMAGQYALHWLNGKGKIIEITGLPKSSPAIERHKGFADALKNYPDLQIIHQVNGEWLNQTAKNEFSKIVSKYPDVNLVFAHNDMMAHGVYEVYKNRGTVNPQPAIIGVDGLPDAGMLFVSGKRITATMLYPTGGEEAIRIALKILNKQNYVKENLLQTTVIDSTNVRIMQLQAAKAISQQQQIERQQSMLKEQKRIYNNQRTFVYILVTSLVLSLILGGLAFYSLRENRKISNKLQQQNQEILDHQARLVEMSAKAKAANEAKVNFFTNISHEFRTPLTLILGPLEELLANSKNHYSTNHTLTLIQKNVLRLLRLVNQLIDFRKIEVDKMRLKASENDLIAFVSDIIQSYKNIAQKRNIDLRLITKERQLTIWMDVNMLDKVIFNLLSNAFKFTKDNGYIHIYISKSENNAIIKMEDNGVGMSTDAIAHAFDVFYQGEYENYKGSGLGLALSKELITLHKGTISVSSEKWKGTCFEICLPLGTAHLSAGEIVEQQQEINQAVRYEHEKIFTADLKTETAIKTEPADAPTEREHTILVIEDNADLRQFLVNKLNTQYEVLEADNGQTGLQQAFDTIPDLIVCDVVIPGKDGMALTAIFKNDLRTSHIPVILLTAKTAMEQQIEGMKNMADAYITKPFNIAFLQQTIKSLLGNRARLKEHYTGELPASLKTQTIGKPDRKFINEFSALVEGNLSNEDLTVDAICKQMGISRVQLYRKVKALMNINVNDYILNTRLQKAKYLLKNEKFTIGEIASRTGFSSSAYFSSVFKARVGITPKEYREK